MRLMVLVHQLSAIKWYGDIFVYGGKRIASQIGGSFEEAKSRALEVKQNLENIRAGKIPWREK